MSHLFALEQGFVSIAILGAMAFVLFVIYTFVATLLRRPRKPPTRPRPRREPIPDPVNDDDDEEFLKEFG